MNSKVCESINTIDKYFDDDSKNPGEYNFMELLNSFLSDCNCSSDEEKIISGFIMLLNTLEDLESDKIVECASLWLSYKLNQKTQNGTTKLYDFYNENIITNSCYKGNISTASGQDINTDVIENKIKSMNMDIKDISNFYDAFKSLCNMYSEIGEKTNTKCNKCLENAGEFFEKCEKVKNVFDITKGSSYLQLWLSLSKDYKDFENNYNSFAFKSLCNMYSEVDIDNYQCKTCLESAGELFEKYEKLKNALDINKGSSYYKLLSSLSKDYKEFESNYKTFRCGNSLPLVACPRSSVTKNILITIGIIFVAASILLGVSYKYSLFGFRKRSQKQHLREKLKK
ncbi:YIR protein [Plasmodium yoelii]|uniref:YIR protein n=1 Tax=Plasmodium yoelii TaxID=5861 RepID=A0A077Y2G7_PLAYE|nr:YIR protein [Plasmodium yoelii]